MNRRDTENKYLNEKSSNRELSIFSIETSTTPYQLTTKQCEQAFGTSIEFGLPNQEAAARIQQYGRNALEGGGSASILQVFIHQFCNAMILVLVIAMCIAFGIKDWISGGVVAAVIIINVGIGTYQEYGAEKTMDALRSLSSPTARVIRNGNDETIPSEEVVPGDIVLVQVGDTIPADFRIVDGMNFETDEALLTGESMPVTKSIAKTFDDVVPVGDRINMAFSSSIVTKGRATGIVTSTGMETEIGVIATSLRGENKHFRPVKRDEFGKARKRDYTKAFLGTSKDMGGAFLGTTVGTPLHRRLAKLAILLFFIAVLCAIIVMATQKFSVNKEVAIYAISVALSMIPSSLTVVLTITMAVGAKVMVTRNVIVRKLDSLEALGAVNDICSDKTGTLTQGKMVARKVWIPTVGTYIVDKTNEPFNPTMGEVSFSRFDPLDDQDTEDETREKPTIISLSESLPSRFLAWVKTATLANIATVSQMQTENGDQEWKAHGDPTEISIQVFTTRLGFPRTKFTEGNNPAVTHLAEYPFDSSIKRMSAIYKMNDTNQVTVFTKGAVERVLRCCTHWYTDSNDNGSLENKRKLTKDDMSRIENNMNALSKEGLRVLAFATKNENVKRDWTNIDRIEVECDLTFLGLVGIYDPPREESRGAVKRCHKAGINVHMLTGDHPGTARAIAQEVGILPHNLYHYTQEIVDAMIMTASDFDALLDEQIDQLPVLPLVIARCAPNTKVRMIESLHRRGAFAAMTGDGVNDSPSLKRADVGIAMGISGSDVAKDASDIVLSDDNFASILNAIEEGRRMAENIQKFVLHLLSQNVAQAIFLLIGLAFKDNDGYSVFPLSPVEVLWIIMVTSCFPAMGLGLEQAEPDIMINPPKDPKEGIFTWELIVDMAVIGIWMAILCITSFVLVMYRTGSANLGYNCNDKFNDSCHDVFRGRSCTFIIMTWCSLLLAWEVIDRKRSLFSMKPESETPYTQVFRDLWRNKFLFWSCMIGFVTVVPVIYIPGLNKVVFKHGPIGWEWAVSIVASILFVIGVEVYKWFKRIYFKRKGAKSHNPEYDLERNSPFAKYASFSRTTTMENGNILKLT